MTNGDKIVALRNAIISSLIEPTMALHEIAELMVKARDYLRLPNADERKLMPSAFVVVLVDNFDMYPRGVTMDFIADAQDKMKAWDIGIDWDWLGGGVIGCEEMSPVMADAEHVDF